MAVSESVNEKIDKGRAQLVTKAVSAHASRLVAASFGSRIPLYYVSGYRRSGGTWFSSMMADYLRRAKPTASLFSIGRRAVVHNHWPFRARLGSMVYRIRDGRDVMRSLYLDTMRTYKKLPGETAHASRLGRRLHSVFNAGIDPDDATTNLPKFIDEEFRSPFGPGRINWADHVGTWMSRAEPGKVRFVRYEGLFSDTTENMRSVLEHVSPIECEDRLLQRTVGHYRMSAIIGRKPGEADADSFVRKGVSGDWQNHFDESAAEVFEHHAGTALREAGYE